MEEMMADVDEDTRAKIISEEIADNKRDQMIIAGAMGVTAALKAFEVLGDTGYTRTMVALAFILAADSVMTKAIDKDMIENITDKIGLG